MGETAGLGRAALERAALLACGVPQQCQERVLNYYQMCNHTARPYHSSVSGGQRGERAPLLGDNALSGEANISLCFILAELFFFFAACVFSHLAFNKVWNIL